MQIIIYFSFILILGQYINDRDISPWDISILIQILEQKNLIWKCVSFHMWLNGRWIWKHAIQMIIC